jgi:hypothetical protein
VERLDKYVSAETNSRNSGRGVFCEVRAEGLWKGQIRSFKSVEFRDASLPGYELESREIDLRESAVEDDGEEVARKELSCAKKTSYVI